MRSRRGVSLIEVIVAALLLGVGVAGTLGAIAAAARLRQRAAVRELVASAALDRLHWFERRACATPDTAGTELLRGVDVAWELRDSLGLRSLRLFARGVARDREPLAIHASWPCA